MRIYMRKRDGYRFVRGGHVIDLQRGIAAGSPTPVSVDSVFGGQTETALKLWQSRNGLPVTGTVDQLTWQGATNKPLPSQFRRCLAVTAAFEGHNYTFAAGNWDNAYLTWGVVGFTLKHGNFGKVIKRINQRHPALLEAAMGHNKAAELLAILSASAAEKKAWGDAISRLPTKYRLVDDWEDAFEVLGNQPEVRIIQDEVAYEVYWSRAVQDLDTFGELTEADAALFFDTAVQNGGVDSDKATRIRNGIAANPGASGRDRLAIIAEAIARGSNPDFYEDVLSRRMTIATGSGVVHGASYFLADWAIDLVDIEAGDLA